MRESLAPEPLSPEPFQGDPGLCSPKPPPSSKQKNGQLIKAVRLRAENETRTRDPNLGKVVLYQLSYFRKISMFSPLALAAVESVSRRRLNRRFGQGCALPTELFPQ